MFEVQLADLETLSVTGTGTTAAILDMGKIRVNPQITSGGLYLTADDTPVTAIAGDDVTVTGSIDGVWYFDLGDAGAAIAYGLDDNGIIAIAGKVRYLKFVAAQVQATEYYKFNVVTPRNRSQA